MPPPDPPGALVDLPPAPPPPSPPLHPSEDMVKALKLLQSVVTPEDFFKYEKEIVVELFEAVQREIMEKQEQKHLEHIQKHQHNVDQQ